MSPAIPVLHGRGYPIDILDHLRGCRHLVEQHGGHVVLDTETQSLVTDSGRSGRFHGTALAVSKTSNTFPAIFPEKS